MGMLRCAGRDQGTLWAPSTCVASIGASRKLCFKALADPAGGGAGAAAVVTVFSLCGGAHLFFG